MADLESFLAQRKISEADLSSQTGGSKELPIHAFITNEQAVEVQKVSAFFN